jgi:hypothetical protein
MTRNQNSTYQGEDATPPELAFTSYFGFDQPGPSHVHHQPWEDHTPYEPETSTGACWGLGASMTASIDRSRIMLLRTTTSLLRNIIINLSITIIIHHL